MTLERNWCRCLAVGDETGSGMMRDVERLPPLGALPLTRHLFPIPLQITCSLFGPQNTIFSLWVMFGRSPSFPCCARCFPCPRRQTPAAPGLCRAERSQDTLMHVREHRPGVNTPFLIQDCCSWRWGGRKKKTLCSFECRSKEIRCVNPY